MRKLTNEELEIISKMDELETKSEEFQILKQRLSDISNKYKKEFPDIDF